MYDLILARRSWTLIACGCFAFLLWPMAFQDIGGTLRFREALTHPVVSGQVIHYYDTNYTLFASRPVFIIRPTNSQEIVFAILDHDQSGSFPAGVSFHYDGDPDREVFLVGEQDPTFYLVLGLFFPAFPWVLRLVYIRFVPPSDRI